MGREKDSATMPFDQYGRYLKVSEIIKELAARKKQSKYTILDVGGYNGSLHRFFETGQADITILDVYDSDQPSYVKGTALQMPFEDKSFDYVVSFEVFEHIPRPDRKKFIQESLRVSKGPLLLTAPFAGNQNEVTVSEGLVNSIWKAIHKKDHQWLHEHILYKTPKVEELETILADLEVSYKKIGNNELLLWNIMQSLTFLTTIYRGTGSNKAVQKFYNQNLDSLEAFSRHYYRFIFLMGAAANTQLKSMSKQSEKDDPKKVYELINLIFQSMSSDVMEIVKDNNAAKQNLVLLESKARSLQKDLDSIKNSPSWKLANKIAVVGRRVPGGKKIGKWIN